MPEAVDDSADQGFISEVDSEEQTPEYELNLLDISLDESYNDFEKM